MQVHINGELYADCVTVDKLRWNGWVTPIFTTEQRAFVLSECQRLGWVDESSEESWELEGWTDLGNDEWVCGGWVWEVVE